MTAAHGMLAEAQLSPDTARLVTARRLLAAQQSLAVSLGNHFMANTSLELLLELFIAHATGGTIAASDAMARLGPAPGVTWRWIMALEDDGLLALGEGPQQGRLEITDRGLERIRNAIDTIAAFG